MTINNKGSHEEHVINHTTIITIMPSGMRTHRLPYGPCFTYQTFFTFSILNFVSDAVLCPKPGPSHKGPEGPAGPANTLLCVGYASLIALEIE